MSALESAAIVERINTGLAKRLSIGDIARLISNGNTEQEMELIIEMSRDYMKGKLRASGDYIFSLVRVRESGWLDGTWREAGKLVTVSQEQYTANSPFLEIVESPYLYNYTVSQSDYIDYLDNRPLPKDCPLQAWVANRATETMGKVGEGIYKQREKSLDALAKSGVDLKLLSVETIFKQVQQKDRKLWNIKLSTFQRDFWPKYKNENNLSKQPGQPSKK